MAEILIFPKQTVALDQYSELGFYTALIDPTPITFTVGESYRVIWNDTEWYCVAQDAGLEGAVFVGDASFMGLSGNGEPFVIGGTAESPMNIISLNDSEPSTRSVAIYKVTYEEPEREGIVLKDRNGNDVVYYGIETVTFDTTTEGKQQVYTKGVAMDGLEIVPDFSGGDMPLSAGEDTLVKSAVIQKPADLSPENVRRGKNIAGVDGDFIGDTEEVTVELDFTQGTSEVEILAEQTLTGFVDGHIEISPSPFVLTEGEIYRVVWDGVEHECVSLINNGVPTIHDLDSLQNPTQGTFLMAYASPEVMGTTSSLIAIEGYDFSSGSFAMDPATDHVIAIYQIVEGGTADMEIAPSATGKVLSHVVVKRPDTLVPENIAENVDIGGVIGSFKGGGLDESLMYFSTHVDPSTNTVVLSKCIYDSIYYKTGSYDTIIPNYIYDMPVVIQSEQRSNSDSYGFFANNKNVTNINIESGVTFANGIMNDTFRDCEALNCPITIPDGTVAMINTFRNCKRFNHPIVFPNSVTNISGAFINCWNFNQPTVIPDSVANISSLFNGCYNFNCPIVIPNNATIISGVLQGCKNYSFATVIPNGVTHMFTAFQDTNVQNITIPESVLYANSAFCYCNNLTDIWIESKTANIGTMLGYRVNTKRVNVHLPANSTTNTYSGYTNYSSIIGSSITWTTNASNNCRYNALKNIYIYWDL